MIRFHTFSKFILKLLTEILNSGKGLKTWVISPLILGSTRSFSRASDASKCPAQKLALPTTSGRSLKSSSAVGQNSSTNRPRAVSFSTPWILTLNLYFFWCYFNSLYWGTSFNCNEKTLKCCSWHQLCISRKITQWAQWAQWELPMSMEDCSKHKTYVLLVMVPAKDYWESWTQKGLKRTDNASCQQSEVGHSPCRLCVTTKSHWSGASQAWCVEVWVCLKLSSWVDQLVLNRMGGRCDSIMSGPFRWQSFSKWSSRLPFFVGKFLGCLLLECNPLHLTQSKDHEIKV